MRIIKEGTEFELKNFNSDTYQVLKFTSKDSEGNFDDGTTNEEIINVLIERFFHLQKVSYSSENYTIIALLKQIRRMLAKRLNKKVNRLKKPQYERC